VATKAQKQELVNILKFTPRSYNIYIGGYGGESYAGKVDRATYEYFKENRIDIAEYANDWDNLFSDVPNELQPFSPGSPYDCDNLFHASGAELTNINEIVINDENGNQYWVCAAGINELEDEGVDVNETGGCEFDDLDKDTIVHWGGQGEKGTFFDGEIALTQPFDPKKLTVNYENCDGWWIINSVEYDGVEIDGSGGYSTTGKWNENKWILCNGDEVYEGVSREDQEEDDDEPESACTSEWPEVEETPNLPVTEWYPVDVKPVHKGEYEVDLGKLVAWPFARIVRAEWTGRSWKDSEGESIKGIEAWRGLAEDPDKLVTVDCECVQCDWCGPIDDTHDEDGEMRCPECGEPVELE
jgi:hypothetical protein